MNLREEYEEGLRKRADAFQNHKKHQYSYWSGYVRALKPLFEYPNNTHFAVFDGDAWYTEHSIDCRLAGNMAKCAYHAAVAKATDDHHYDKGRYELALGPDGALYMALKDD